MHANSARLVRLPPYYLLEAWRGLAALWVALLHALLNVVSPGAMFGTDPVSALIAKGQLGVTIFFVVSGYCIANAAVSARARPRPVRSFLAARVRRIYPPYLFSLALWYGSLAAGSVLFASALSTPVDLRGEILGRGPIYVFATLTLTQMPLRQPMALVIYWSLCYEVAFYVIVAAGMGLTRRGRDAVPLLYALHALTIASLAGLIANRGIPFPLDLWPQFGLGVLAYHVASATDKRGPLAVLALAMAMTVAYALPRGDGGDFAHPSTRVLFLFGIAYTVVMVGLRGLDASIGRWPVVRGLAWVGTFSYSLYLTHLVVLTLAGKLLRGPLLGVWGPWALVLAQVALAVAFARAYYAWFERPFIAARSVRPSPAEEAPGVAAIAGSTP